MKRFVDDQGLFELLVPINWNYTLMNGYVHTFRDYEKHNADCFQLSLNDIENDEKKKELAHLFGYLKPTMIGELDYRSYDDEESEESALVIKTWTTIWSGTRVLFSFAYDKETSESLEEKLEIVYTVIGSLYIFEQQERMQRLNSYRFEMFLQGIGASVVMLNKAIDNMAFIEATCLLANQIDSLLRIAIVLKKQIINQNDDIETEWIYQGVNDKRKSEKDIYKKSKEISVITDDIFDELFRLYEDRNRVIHRFIISEITLAEVEMITYNYYKIREEVKMIVDDIESEQIRLGTGMTIVDESNPGNKSHFLNAALGKIGKLDYFIDKKNKEDDFQFPKPN